MKQIHITEDFTGYPSGAADKDFVKGETVEVSDVFAELVIAKGHAREAKVEAPAPAKKDDAK